MAWSYAFYQVLYIFFYGGSTKIKVGIHSSFHSYSSLVAITYYTQLKIVSSFLLMSAPITAVLLIIMHQQSLQKNFIVPKVIKHISNNDTLWMDELMRTCLAALNKQKEIICLIERSDDLKTVVSAEHYLHADFKKDFLDLLIDHIDTQAGDMLWIDQTGKLIGINARLALNPQPSGLANDANNYAAFKQEAVVLTGKTDALIMQISTSSRLFTCIVQAKIVEGLTAQHMLMLLKKYLTKPYNSQKDRYIYAQSQRNFKEQQLT